MKKQIVMGLVLILIGMSFVSANQKLCLGYEQSVPSDENPRYTCWHDVCYVCVDDDNKPTHNGYCRDIEGCNILGNTTFDVTPPNLIIKSPIQDFVYSSRKVLFDLLTNEPSSIYYLDNINGRGRWKRLSSKTQSYSRKISFKDGLNDITIKARDKNQNFIEVQRQFYVDSKKPKIRRTFPKKGFADGFFEAEVTEENIKSLILNYGNNDEMNVEELDVSKCDYKKKKYYCDVVVDLKEYDGEEIEYWFVVTDIADNFYESKKVNLDVDTTSPILNNDDEIVNGPNSFWSHEEGNKYVYFNLDITEKNFDEVIYVDHLEGSRRTPREKRLCSRLKNGGCEKRKGFRKGHHVVDIQINDEAGNAIGKSIEFDVF